MRCTRALCLVAMALLGLAAAANAQCTASTPKLVLTDATDKSDPIAQCLSSFSLAITGTCGTSINTDSLVGSAGTVRLQRLDLSDNNLIKRNAMLTDFPYIGDDVYANCSASVDTATGTGASAIASLGALLSAVDGWTTWTVSAPSSGSISATGGGVTLTWAIVGSTFSGAAAITSTDSESVVTVNDGEYAELVSEADKTYIAALCPSGTYSSRSGTKKTIKTGCDTVDAGRATNKVGATSATDNTACEPGTYAAQGAAMCLPCDVDQFAPFAEMDVCGECQDGYAPIQGSSRCFAGFSGRVLVTEGLSTDGKTVYDPNGVIIKIYGDVAADVTANAVIPAGTSFTTDTAPGVAAFGGALDGWSVINWGAATGTSSVQFLDQCVAGASNTNAVVAVSEDVKSAVISMVASTKCGQLNNKTIDLSDATALVAAGFSTGADSNWLNLTLAYASPSSLIAFGLTGTGAGTAAKVTLYVTGSALNIYGQASTTAQSMGTSATRAVTTVANSFGAYVQPTAPTCTAGTTYVEKADASGTTYSRQCRPCPDGYYCPAGRSGFSPVATPCPAGTRATLFAQTLSGQCSQCADSYYQDTAGSTTCDFCGTAKQGATTCPTTCPDGTQGDPRAVGGCTDCPAGTYRSGDMPACIACGTGSQVFQFNSTGDDNPIDSRSATGGQDCRPCDPGFFNDISTVGVCSACAAGSYSPRGGQASCIPCPAGQWQDQQAAPSCKKAAKGTYISATGATVNNVLCPAGYFGEVAGAVSLATGCKKCKPGGFSNTTGATFCQTCKTGYYQDKSAQTTCTQCPAGTINTAVGSATCAICAPGSFSAKGASTCSKCPVGTYQDRAKQSGCKPCPAGSFCSQAGMVAPTKCPIGTYNPRPNGSSQRLACLPCTNAKTAGASKC